LYFFCTLTANLQKSTFKILRKMQTNYRLLLAYVLVVLSNTALYGQTKPATTTKTLTLEDIYQKRLFTEKSVYGINWTKNGQFYTSLDAEGIVKYDITTGKPVETLVSFAQLNPKIAVDDYTFSADEKKLLFTTNTEAIYRRSFRADYYVYDLIAKTLKPLTTEGRQSYATFSPDGSKVAFVRDNNLFLVDLNNSATVTQITEDGKFNFIINGSTDWVYEEELGFAQAFFWSPDSKKIAFYKFDESKVKEYNMQVWDEKQLYPVDYRFKYPKAGEANSVVNIFTYNLENKKTVKMDIGSETDIYIPRIKWTKKAETLAIRRMSRLQNKLEILHANANTGSSKAILTEKNDTYVDVEYADDLIYLKDGKQFILTSEADGYKHFYLYEFTADTSRLIRQITNGKWEVADFVGINENVVPNLVYFTSTEDSPLERQFYSIDIEGKKKTKQSREKGTNSVNMSPDFSHYILFNTSSLTPTKVSIFKTERHELKYVREDNADLRKQIADFGLQPKEFFQFIATDNTVLYGYWIKPKDFDAKKKYPVLMFVYGGPSSQNVKDSWADGQLYFHHYLAQQGYLVACVDNRGTAARGAAFKKATYANLGKYEAQDQIDAANYIGSQPFVEKTRIGIWGWSYGGYISSLCMMLGADVFKAGIAVAPVSTWRLYDTIYTERFLKRPFENAEGYDRNSPLTHADKLKGSYLLVHGTGDDNVHFQNTVLLQNALIKAGKQFDSFYYPNRNHGIYGGNTKLHLYQMMTNFIKKSL
jgi:dipeptidyl-peptidase-4